MRVSFSSRRGGYVEAIVPVGCGKFVGGTLVQYRMFLNPTGHSHSLE
jgi:hypothetical protein